MKNLLFVTILFCAMRLNAQTHIQWTSHEVTPWMQINEVKNSAVDQSGNSYFINFTQSSINFYVTYRFFCYDAAGVKKWQYDNDSCFTDCNDKYFGVVPLNNGQVIFVGYYEDLTTANTIIRIKCIDANGGLAWQNYWTSPYKGVRSLTAQLDHAGDLIVSTEATIVVADQEDYCVAKFNTTDGSNIWHLEIPDTGGSSGTLSEIFSDLRIDDNNDIYGCGTWGGTFASIVGNVYMKISSSGSLDYMQVVPNLPPTPTGDGVRKILPDNDGHLYLLITQGITTRLDKYEAVTGNFLWTKYFQNDTNRTHAADLVCTNDAVYILSNYNHFIVDTNPWIGGRFTNFDYMVTRTDTSGTAIWQNSFFEDFDLLADSTASGGGVQMIMCNENLYVLSGSPYDQLTSYLILNKIDQNGISAWHDSTLEDYGVGSMGTDDSCNIYIPRTARLGAPTFHTVIQKFSENTVAGIPTFLANQLNVSWFMKNEQLLFDLGKTINGKAELFDLQGRLLDSKEVHSEQFTFDTGNLALGVYLVKIQDKENLKTVKVLID